MRRITFSLLAIGQPGQGLLDRQLPARLSRHSNTGHFTSQLLLHVVSPVRPLSTAP